MGEVFEGEAVVGVEDVEGFVVDLLVGLEDGEAGGSGGADVHEADGSVGGFAEDEVVDFHAEFGGELGEGEGVALGIWELVVSDRATHQAVGLVVKWVLRMARCVGDVGHLLESVGERGLRTFLRYRAVESLSVGCVLGMEL